jgi:hypothetical protein
MLRFLLIQALSFMTLPAFAQTTPVRRWPSVDEATGKPRAEIRIGKTPGALVGRIERSPLPVPPDAVLLCALCPDDRKDKPLIGMEIIRQMKPSEKARTCEGGEIPHPDKGKVLKLWLQLQDDSKDKYVRGHLGPFFRNQTWVHLS